jgi:glycosyltransferase involved in cell wall biosynthesis
MNDFPLTTEQLTTEQLTTDLCRPLNVQFVLTSLPVGGAETLLLNLVRGMDRQRFSPEVVCLKEAGELGPFVEQTAPLSSHWIKNKWDASVLFRLTGHFRSRCADAVITVGAGDKMFWGRLAAWRAGVPVICSAIHSTGWPDGIGKLNRCLTGITDAFIAVAHNHASFLVQHEKFPEDRVFMIPNGIDVNRFVPDPTKRRWLREYLSIPADAPLVGVVAALRKEKNLTQFISSASIILQQQSDVHFVLVGDGPERITLQQQVAHSGKANHFHFLGCRNDTESILAGLDVFCLTSLNEANPVSILEALACKVPVVSPNIGSIAETVRHGETGFLSDLGCAESTARYALELLRNPSLANKLGENGRASVSCRWSLEAMVSGYESLIETLYNQKLAIKPSTQSQNGTKSSSPFLTGLDLDCPHASNQLSSGNSL